MAKQVKTCKFCGEGGLHWTQTLGGWKLMDPHTGALHQCNPTRTSLMASALALGLNAEQAKTMRLKDLQEWIENHNEVNGNPTEAPGAPDTVGIPDDVDDIVKTLQDIGDIKPKPVVPKPDLPEGIDHVHPNYYKAVARFKANPKANQWWAGPAGSGKTTLAGHVAAALGKTLAVVSISKNTQEFDLLGYNDGHGRYVKGKLFDPLSGKDQLILIDECDRGTDGVLVCLNMILDQRFVEFPNGNKVHIDESNIFVATGNTWGLGADAAYSAASQLDAAFLDRFPVKLPHDYDEKFELNISCNRRWTELVQRVRRAVFQLKLQQIVVGPRASIHGGLLINNGIPWNEVEQEVIWANIPEEQRASIRARMAVAA